MGSVSTKPTRIMHYRLDLSKIKGKCNHEAKWWTIWDKQNRPRYKFQSRDPLPMNNKAGTFASKATAAYPYELNKAIVNAFINIPITDSAKIDPSQNHNRFSPARRRYQGRQQSRRNQH